MISPITPLVVGNNGAFRAVRSSSAQGSCGVHGYPCLHPGVDVNAPAGTPVKAPEAGVVVAAADGAAAPFRGYGPWLVMILGASGKYHLLAHLDPASSAMAPVGSRVTEGQVVGRVSSARHTHWEVRVRPTPPTGQTNLDNNLDPISWMKGVGSVVLLAVLAGGAYWIWREMKRR
jgi:murein DD-endopeptidase MepM/ murein hydrolase activator NlpD